MTRQTENGVLPIHVLVNKQAPSPKNGAPGKMQLISFVNPATQPHKFLTRLVISQFRQAALLQTMEIPYPVILKLLKRTWEFLAQLSRGSRLCRKQLVHHSDVHPIVQKLLGDVPGHIIH